MCVEPYENRSASVQEKFMKLLGAQVAASDTKNWMLSSQTESIEPSSEEDAFVEIDIQANASSHFLLTA